jgi:hypothetical protein
MQIQPPEQPASQTMTDSTLIKTYNNLLTLQSNLLNDATVQDLKQELISRNIITEDHEGEIVT